VHFLVVNLENQQTVPELINSSENGTPVRKISIDMDIADFFALFKSFEVTLSPEGMFEGKDYKAV
jgi:hypothetical protein